MKNINISKFENRETALVLLTDRMARVAQNPLTRTTADEVRRLARKITELTGLVT